MTLTLQERNARNTRRHQRLIAAQSLIIEIHSWDEREFLRSRVWYSGASEEYIATSMDALPLAVAVLMRARRRDTVKIRRTKGGFVLTAKRRRLIRNRKESAT